MHMVSLHTNTIMSFFKCKGLLSPPSKTYRQIEKLALLKLTSFQCQVFAREIGHQLV